MAESRILRFLLGLLTTGCATLHEVGLFVPAERNVIPELTGGLTQHQIFNVLWRAQLMKSDWEPIEHHHFGSIEISNDGTRIFVGSHSSGFFAFDSQSGAMLWQNKADGPFDSPPTLKDGIVYVGSGAGTLWAFREKDGAVVWSYQTNAAVDGKPQIVGHNLLVTTDTNTLLCLDALTGKWRWNYKREMPTGRFLVKGVSNPLVVGDNVYVGFSDGFIARLALDDGAVKSVKSLVKKGARFTDADTDPVLIDDTLLTGSFSMGVVAMNRESFREKWVHSVNGPSNLVVDGGRVYFSTADSTVEALAVDTGKPIWRFNAEKGSLSQPVIVRDWLMVSSSEYSLLVLDKRDGSLLQIFNPGKGANSIPIARGNRAYWISNGQTLYCLDLLR